MNHNPGEFSSIVNSEVKALRLDANVFIGKFRNYHN